MLLAAQYCCTLATAPPLFHFSLSFPTQFTKFLKRDYARWAEGDDSRSAVVSDGEALIEEDGV